MIQRVLLHICAVICLCFAFIGVIFPVFPMMPFVILAAMCWGKASPVLHGKLKQSPLFGKIIEDWESKRVISRQAKLAAVFMMIASCSYITYVCRDMWLIPLLAVLICILAGIWIFRYPDA